MSRRTSVETGRDRRALAADAGFGAVSLPSILAGVLVAYGAFAILAALGAAIVDAIGVETDIISTDYERLSIAGGLITAAILFLSYLFGGYVAGRMARRSGVVQGILVAVLGLVIVAAVAALVSQATDTDEIVGNLRDLGVPTTADEYGQAFTVAGLAALAGIGFTVSIFVAGLAFDDAGLQEQAKVGVLAASLIAGALGAGILMRSGPAPAATEVSHPPRVAPPAPGPG